MTDISASVSDFVEFRNVAAWNGATRVFDNLNLVLPLGCNTAVVGPNGAGKSTLLKLLSREIHPEHREGSTLRLFGRERWNVWELRSHLGIVSHELQGKFPRRATGRDVILSGFHSSLGVWPHQRFTEEDRTRTDDILDRLGTGALGPKRYAAMSTGEQRRILLGRALVHGPEVLVLDEPTSGLDPKACFQYIDLVRGLMQSGTTVVLVTHHIHEIPPEVERVVVLKAGQVFADGPTSEVLTSRLLREAFEAPVRVVRANGFYQLFPDGQAESE